MQRQQEKMMLKVCDSVRLFLPTLGHLAPTQSVLFGLVASQLLRNENFLPQTDLVVRKQIFLRKHK